MMESWMEKISLCCSATGAPASEKTFIHVRVQCVEHDWDLDCMAVGVPFSLIGGFMSERLEDHGACCDSDAR